MGLLLNLFPEHVRSPLQKLFEIVKESCVSIMLTGSWIRGSAHRDSDIDLFFITKNDLKAKKRVKSIVAEYGKQAGLIEGYRPRLDCKVYTEHELMNLAHSNRNFYFFSCFSGGKTIYGRDMTQEIKLLPDKMLNNLKRQIEQIESVINLLNRGFMPRMVCFHLFFALKTFYFVEQFLMGEESSVEARKKLYIKMFGSIWRYVKREAYKAMREAGSNDFEMHIKVKIRVGVKISEAKRKKLREAADKILKYGNEVYKRSIAWNKTRIRRICK